MVCTAEELHEMLVHAIMMPELETFKDGLFEWDTESDECERVFVEPVFEVLVTPTSFPSGLLL